MLVINSAEAELGLILYVNGCGYGRPARLKEAEKCELYGPYKAVWTLDGPLYHEIEGTVEFLPETSPLPGVYAAPEPDTLAPILVQGKNGQGGCLYVWRFRPGYRPNLFLR